MNRKIHALVMTYCICVLPVASRGQESASQPVGVVSHVKVLSDKVPDGTSIVLELADPGTREE